MDSESFWNEEQSRDEQMERKKNKGSRFKNRKKTKHKMENGKGREGKRFRRMETRFKRDGHFFPFGDSCACQIDLLEILTEGLNIAKSRKMGSMGERVCRAPSEEMEIEKIEVSDLEVISCDSHEDFSGFVSVSLARVEVYLQVVTVSKDEVSSRDFVLIFHLHLHLGF